MFKDAMGRWVTVGLFKETAGPNKSFVIMSLQEACAAFVATGDLTGYKFASEYLGGYQHWKELEQSGVAPHIEEWKEELEVKLRSEALLRVESEARKGHFQANKLLIDKGWEKKGAGRPSKESIEKEARKQQRIAGQVQDYLRPVK